MDCIFCKIAAGSVPAEILYQDEDLISFRDINPQAPVHLLIVPRKHIANLNDLSDDDSYLVGKMAKTAKQLALSEGISEQGYRLVLNCGDWGGQLVQHIHMHVIGGRRLDDRLG
ncbi:MAG: histidine triad nucleotide-binding protein [Dehalococcoidales bacterium]